MAVQLSAAQASDGSSVLDPVQARPQAFHELDGAAQRVGDHQDVRKQDRRVHAKATDRLQGDLDRKRWRVAELQKAVCPAPQRRYSGR